VRRSRTTQLAGVLSAAALAAAACGEPPGEEAADGDGNGADFVGCMITDEGGVDDKSFNETSWKGLQDAHAAGETAQPKVAESEAVADYEPNIQAMLGQDCGLIVTVGFNLADDTEAAAEANPEQQFAIVDELMEVDNVKSLVFNTHEAAFLAGYVAAGHSEAGRVATWGGMKIPTVTIFMDGFYDGVQHYNETHDEDVQVLGWDKQRQDGQFVGDFSDTGAAQQVSENLIGDGADVIMPVAGPIGEAAAVAAKDAGDVAVIWVDSDGYESVPEHSEVMLTSVIKGMDVAVEEAVTAAAHGEFSNEPFIGTLENEGVSIAPFHDFDGELDDGLKDEVEQLKQQIIDGELEVETDAAF
jgi:basic membrane protein A and related proteins